MLNKLFARAAEWASGDFVELTVAAYSLTNDDGITTLELDLNNDDAYRRLLASSFGPGQGRDALFGVLNPSGKRRLITAQRKREHTPWQSQRVLLTLHVNDMQVLPAPPAEQPHGKEGA